MADGFLGGWGAIFLVEGEGGFLGGVWLVRLAEFGRFFRGARGLGTNFGAKGIWLGSNWTEVVTSPSFWIERIRAFVNCAGGGSSGLAYLSWEFRGRSELWSLCLWDRFDGFVGRGGMCSRLGREGFLGGWI